MDCDKLSTYTRNARATVKITKQTIIPNKPTKGIKQNLKKCLSQVKSEKEEKKEQHRRKQKTHTKMVDFK